MTKKLINKLRELDLTEDNIDRGILRTAAGFTLLGLGAGLMIYGVPESEITYALPGFLSFIGGAPIAYEGISEVKDCYRDQEYLLDEKRD